MSKIDEIEQALGREKTLDFIRFLLVELRGYYTHLVARYEHSCRNESIYYAHKMQFGVAMFQASDLSIYLNLSSLVKPMMCSVSTSETLLKKNFLRLSDRLKRNTLL